MGSRSSMSGSMGCSIRTACPTACAIVRGAWSGSSRFQGIVARLMGLVEESRCGGERGADVVGLWNEAREFDHVGAAQEVAQEPLLLLAKVGRRAGDLQELLGSELGRAKLEAVFEITADERGQLDEELVDLVGIRRQRARRQRIETCARKLPRAAPSALRPRGVVCTPRKRRSDRDQDRDADQPRPQRTRRAKRRKPVAKRPQLLARTL